MFSKKYPKSTLFWKYLVIEMAYLGIPLENWPRDDFFSWVFTNLSKVAPRGWVFSLSFVLEFAEAIFCWPGMWQGDPRRVCILRKTGQVVQGAAWPQPALQSWLSWPFFFTSAASALQFQAGWTATETAGRGDDLFWERLRDYQAESFRRAEGRERFSRYFIYLTLGVVRIGQKFLLSKNDIIS